MRISEIILEVNNVDQILIKRNALFYGKRVLSTEAEKVIIEEATLNYSYNHIHMKILSHGEETDRQDEISNAIHQHFTYRRVISEKELKKILQLGWRSLLISIVFFGLLISLTLVILKLIPEGGFATTFREILIILGWVALWRPADLLLFEWRLFKREVNLFRKLEQCRVEIVKGEYNHEGT